MFSRPLRIFAANSDLVWVDTNFAGVWTDVNIFVVYDAMDFAIRIIQCMYTYDFDYYNLYKPWCGLGCCEFYLDLQ